MTTEPLIQWREGYVSRWVNSSQLALVPIEQADPVRLYSRFPSKKRKSGIDPIVLKMAIRSAASEFKVEPWMVKNPSKNTDVQKARGKAAHLLMGLRNDDGTSAYTDDQITIALNFYDDELMFDAAALHLPDDEFGQ